MRLGEPEIRILIPTVESVSGPISGGQKTVFRISIQGKPYALKLLKLEGKIPAAEDDEDRTEEVEQTLARARREVDILKDCGIPELVRLGPIPLTPGEANGESLIFFTEEWVEGRDLRTIIAEGGPLSIDETVRLGRDVNRAISMLWSLSKVHRDIKPANIMRRTPPLGFVLLDLGLALDLKDESLTDPGLVPGTLPYFSPEQLDANRKRNMDFRSDLYSLGVVMYEAVTGSHPYYTPGMRSKETITNILSAPVIRPSVNRKELPADLDEIIVRLMAKNPHMRYRTCEHLEAALARAAGG
jgi:eukaryotic-like serine/threonine-protein kinase